MEKAMRVLIIKMSSMGDIIHTLPAVRDAMRALPNIQFDWVVEKSFSEIPLWNPIVSRVIPIELRKWRQKIFSATVKEDVKKFLRLLREVRYDAIIDGQGLLKSALICLSAHGPTYGYDRKSIREPLASFFYKNRFNCDYQQHAIDRLRKLFSFSLNYSLPNLKEIDYGLLERFQENDEWAHKKYIIFLHGTSAAQKLWRTDNWLVLGRLLQDEGYSILLPWGSHDEFKRAQHIAAHLQSELVHVLPRLSLTELKHRLFYATAVVSVDTGLAHLAAALNKTNFVLYANTNPELIGTRGLRQHYFNMHDITVKQLFQKICFTLNEPKSYLKFA